MNSILSDEKIVLNRKATDVSGNLDAVKIRNICKDHGINYTLSSDCRGGSFLTDVKEKRNDLAHGTISFAECRRNYSIEQLLRIKEETTSFLENILDGMKEYYDEKKYLM